MKAQFLFLTLEFKRAWKRMPYVAAGAAVLMLMLGVIAYAAGTILQGEEALGRISIGVVLPKEDTMAEMAVRMLGSLDSVDSLCDFIYMEEEEAKQALEKREILGVMTVPEKMIQGIMDGSNPPVSVFLPQKGLESAVFKELTMAGARTLSAAQAGIYAGDQLLRQEGLEERIPELEADLNQIYMAYSLPRIHCFKREQVSASGEVGPFAFYGISGFVLFLLLEVIPASGYLAGESKVLDQKLWLLGIGPVWITFVRMLCLSFLLLAAGLVFGSVFAGLGYLKVSWTALACCIVMCLLAASMALFFFECTGTLMGGVLLLSAASMVLLFLSGGMVPLVFLPEGIKRAAPWLPVSLMLECGKMAVLGQLKWKVWLGAILYSSVFFTLAAGVRKR